MAATGRSREQPMTSSPCPMLKRKQLTTHASLLLLPRLLMPQWRPKKQATWCQFLPLPAHPRCPARRFRLAHSHLAAFLKDLFFHECGRRVGGVPRSSLKGKETQHDEGKRTQATPKPSKTHQTKTTTKNQNATKGQRPIPPHLTVFPLYQGETCEKTVN